MHRWKANSRLLPMALAALWLAAPSLWAQSAGQAEVALQGYYLGGSGQSVLGTSGVAVNTRQFIPGRGLFSATAEGYGSNGFRTGNLFAGLQGMPLAGWHWDFLGGDFHFSTNMVENPFLNIYSPEIAARGVRVVMKRKDRSFQFFVGEDSLLGGPRIPYRVLLPQLVLGASWQQNVGKRWQFGLRYLHLSTNSSVYTDKKTFVIAGHDYLSSNSLTFQSSYSFTKRLKFYSEASLGSASSFTPAPVSQQPFSLLLGPSWQGDKFSLRANYVRQSASYMPLLGSFVGDRKGPYAEGHYRPFHWVDLNASASKYSNNLEGNPGLPTFHSSGYSGGASFNLPWKFSASGSLSTIHLTQRDPVQQGDILSDNRQLNFNLGRTIGRHSLLASVIDMKLNSNLLLQNQRFLEVADNFSWKRFTIGGAVRKQTQRSTENRNTLFYRGSIQTHIKSFSIYAYIEKGNDLVNKSVFSTNSYSSTVFGISAPLRNGWRMQFEAFRNNLNTALNPVNIFLFGGGELSQNSQLAAFNQWSVYLRIGKQFQWGKGLPGSGSMEEYAAQHAPLVGTVQGLVMEQSLAGPRPAAHVAISLDSYRNAVTDASGRYLFAAVPEGSHEVGFDMEQLPADYNPDKITKLRVNVAPNGVARADFGVFRLTCLTGQVVAPANTPLEDIVIRLKGTDRYTTPDADGNFGFDNLPEGEYDVVIEVRTVPDGYLLASPAAVHTQASCTNPAALLKFELKEKPVEEKPIREIQQPAIHIGGGGPTIPLPPGRR